MTTATTCPSALEIRLQLARAHYTLSVDLALPSSGITVFFGVSGSGKTSLLRCVAGLENTGKGLVRVGHNLWQDDEHNVFLPTWKRSLGYVFQEASLFAHLTVQQNLAYGFKRAKRKVQDDQTPEALMQRLGIADLAKRRSNQLSGGERQRVAIARALATQPQVLLLDEPLANLDVTRRKDVLPWLLRLRDTLNIPMLYVTHSTAELEALADHVVVLDRGQVVANGSLQTVTADHSTSLLADLHNTNYLQATVLRNCDEWGLLKLQTAAGQLRVRPAPDADQARKQLRLRIRPHDISLSTQAPCPDSVDNTLIATVQSLSPDHRAPSDVCVRLLCHLQELRATISRRAAQTLGLTPGQEVWVRLHNIQTL